MNVSTAEIVKREPDVQAGPTREQIELIKRTVARGTTDDEFALLMHTARRTGLDPLLKQIHAVKRWDNSLGREVMSIQTGIDGYRLVASRTGVLAGIDDAVFEERPDSEFPVKATVTVWKLVEGQRCPFTATARWNEYKQTKKDGQLTSFWKRMPYGQLAKCAESLALRKAFPADLSGLYTFEEMQQSHHGPPEGKTEEESIHDYEQEHVEVIAKAEGWTPIEGVILSVEISKGLIWLGMAGCALFAKLDAPFASQLTAANNGWVVNAYCQKSDKQTRTGDPIYEIRELKSCDEPPDMVPILEESVKQANKKRAKKAEESLVIDAEDAKAFGEKGVF